MKHHPIGGSSVGRLLACPGSLELVKRYGQDTTSAAAEEGTRLHDAMAALLLDQPDALNDLDREQHKLIGDACAQLAEFEAANDLGPPALLAGEVEVYLSWEAEIPDAGGTADLLHRYDDANLVVDWKFGRYPVDARTQLLFYAAGALLRGAPFAPELPTYLVTIQPRVSDTPTVHTVTTDDINNFIDDVLDAFDEDYLATGDHCRWCPAQHACPKWEQTARRYQGPVPADITELLDLADDTERYIKALRAEATRRLEAGHEIPGWTLAPKRAQRKWIDEDLVRKWARKVKLKVTDIEERKLKSPAQMQRVLEESGILLENLDSLTTRESSGLTLARVSDKSNRGDVE